jgi:hypothetical protein
MLLRRAGLVCIPVAVVLFAVTFLHLATSGASGSCYGSDCLRGEGRWDLLLPGSIFLFVGGLMMAAYSGRGLGRTQGPRSFDEVRTGATTLPAPSKTGTVRPVPRWTKAWRNAFGYTAAGELFLGVMFFVVGVKQPDGRGGAFFTGGVLGGIGLVFAWLGWRMAAKDALHETGLKGTARILSVRQTGMWMNNNPVVVLDLAVSVPDEPTYEVRHRETVPVVALGRLAQGDELDVRVDKRNPSDLIVLW